MASIHWEMNEDESIFYLRGKVKKLSKIPPGVYEISHNQRYGFFFKKIDYKIQDLLVFEDTIVDKAVEEINMFWKKRELFKKHDFPFKRGIILHGPPGSGKSCTIKLIINNIIKQGGIAINFNNSTLFRGGISELRMLQKDLPIVAIMEDLDSILYNNDQSDILDLLDGLDGFENIVYLATTNYIDKLQDRVKNRPSRFDRRYFVDFPSERSRLQYLQYLVKDSDFKNLPLEKWAADTQGFSVAHLKELYVSVVFFESDYEETLKILRNMKNIEDYNDENDDDDDEKCYFDEPALPNLSEVSSLLSKMK